MITKDAKLFLIKALIEGVECNLRSISEMEDFIDTYKTILSENRLFKGKMIGDIDGLLIEDETGMPVASVIVTGKRIKFHPLLDDVALDLEVAEMLARVVIASVSALLIEEQKKKLANDLEKETEFNNNDFGIIK
tara:strand:+ start:1230 stop:1634 length:405 start_codon:yes stop_codon:yes gene_type:complete